LGISGREFRQLMQILRIKNIAKTIHWQMELLRKTKFILISRFLHLRFPSYCWIGSPKRSFFSPSSGKPVFICSVLDLQVRQLTKAKNDLPWIFLIRHGKAYLSRLCVWHNSFQFEADLLFYFFFLYLLCLTL
jgi:hypothetical protein